MDTLADSLIEQRRQQKPTPDYPKKEELQNFSELASLPLHKSTAPQVDSLDIHGSEFLLTGGHDGQAILFSLTKN